MQDFWRVLLNNVLLVECCFFHVSLAFNITCRFFIICYQASQLVEILTEKYNGLLLWQSYLCL